jgi:Domain of unknown function (DUF4105)
MLGPFTHPAANVAQKIAKAVGLFLLGLLMLALAGWGALALHYWDHAGSTFRQLLAAAWSLASLALIAGFLMRRWRWRSAAALGVLFTALLGAWSALEASNDRDWVPENSRLAYATIHGDRITLYNIRNFGYRTETDFTPAYYDRTFDLRQLNEVDLFAVYWMGPAIAHVFLSFGFTDGAHVAISVETRREQGQTYSSLQGFFRQYTLYYAVGDERDIVRVRTSFRTDPPERVYMYRLRGSRIAATRLFLGYLRRINSLREHAEWYNTLTSNCANSVWLLARLNPGHVPYSWRVMLSGYLPEYLYEQRKLDTRMPFAELRRRALINSRAQRADNAADFSQRIRAGLD